METEDRLMEAIAHAIMWLDGEGFDTYKPMPASQCHQIADILREVFKGKTIQEALQDNNKDNETN